MNKNLNANINCSNSLAKDLSLCKTANLPSCQRRVDCKAAVIVQLCFEHVCRVLGKCCYAKCTPLIHCYLILLCYSQDRLLSMEELIKVSHVTESGCVGVDMCSWHVGGNALPGGAWEGLHQRQSSEQDASEAVVRYT